MVVVPVKVVMVVARGLLMRAAAGLVRLVVVYRSALVATPVVVPPLSVGGQQPIALRYLGRWPGVDSRWCWRLPGWTARH